MAEALNTISGIRRRVWIHLAVLTGLALCVYIPSLDAPTINDDPHALLRNYDLRTLWPIMPLLDVRDDDPLTSRPVVALSFALNYAVTGEFNRQAFRAVNVALHVVCVLLLYGIIRRTLRLPALRDRWGEHAESLALVIAGLWAVHPLNTETVIYITQRTEGMMGMFFVLTLYAAIRAWTPTPAPGSSGKGRGWSILAVAACALGMGSKEVMVGAPLLVLLYDRAFASGSWRRVWGEHRALHVGLLATYAVLATVMATGHRENSVGTHHMSSWEYLRVQAGVILRYFELSVWPMRQSTSYHWPPPEHWSGWLPQGLVMLALAGATAWALVRRPMLGFLGAWVFVILAPTSSVLPIVTEVGAERRMYLPLMAIIALIVIGAAALIRRLGRHNDDPAGLAHRAGLALSVIVLAGLTGWAMARVHVWHSGESIFSDALKKFPDNPNAMNDLAATYNGQGEYEKAEALFLRSLEINDHYYLAWRNLGSTYRSFYDFYTEQHDPEAARRNLDDAYNSFYNAVQLNPDDGEAQFGLADTMNELGRDEDRAVEHYRLAIRADERHVKAMNNLAKVLMDRGEMEEAEQLLQRALKYEPKYAKAQFNLGHIRLRQGRREEAAALFTKAVELDDKHAEAHHDLGVLLAQLGEVDEGLEHLSRAAELNPDDAKTRDNLGVALSMAGRRDEAIAAYKKAMELDPDYEAAGQHLREMGR